MTRDDYIEFQAREVNAHPGDDFETRFRAMCGRQWDQGQGWARRVDQVLQGIQADGDALKVKLELEDDGA